MRKALLLPLLWLACVHAKPHHVLMVPKNIYQGNDAEIALYLIDVTSPGSVTVQLRKENETIAEKTFDNINPGDASPTVLKFPVPMLNKSYYYAYKLKAKGKFGDYSIDGEVPINVREQRSVVFVQTSKPIYKPGETVKFRILPLSAELKPERNAQALVFITDPDSNRVAQWNNVTFENGIVQREFELSEEPILGSAWQIWVRFHGRDTDTTKSFEVAEYVLPKFEVTVKPPSYALTTDETITFKICAKYTHGKPVHGNISMNASYPQLPYYYRPAPDVYGDSPFHNESGILGEDGCYDYVLKAAELNFTRKYNYGVMYGQRIIVHATVTEDGTGIKRDGSGDISPTDSPLRLSFPSQDGINRYFKPRLPYYGKIKVTYPNDTAAANQVIQVCAVSTRERYVETFYHEKKSMVNCKNYTSDADGEVDYIIPPYNASVISIKVIANAVEYPTEYYENTTTVMRRQPTTSVTLQAFWSPSQNFLQFDPAEKTSFQCNETINARALYTVPENSSSITLFYQLMSRGKMVKQGKMEVAAHRGVKLSGDWIKQEHNCPTCLDLEYPEANEDKAVAEIIVPIKASPGLMPSVRILLWYALDGEVIAGTQEYQLDPCLSNDVKISFIPKEVQPGANISIKVEASPKSQCGFGVVDKAVQLLRGDTSITRKMIVNAYKNFDVSAWASPTPDTYGYCRKKGKPENKVSDSYVGGPYGGSQSSYVDAEYALSDAGYAVITDYELATRPCHSLETTQYENVADMAPAHRVPGSVPKASVGKMRIAEAAPAPGIAGPAGFGGGGGSFASQATVSVVDVRQDFSDTWLFDLIDIDDNGQLTRDEETPHSITEWVANAVCVNDNEGLGVAEPVTFKTFQAFFMGADLPYSVKRGEEFDLRVTASNYLNDTLPIEVSVELSEGLTTKNSSTYSTVVCLGPNQNRVLTVPVSAELISESNITVKGVSASDSTALQDCDAANTIGEIKARDVLRKTIIVKPEGFSTDRIENWLVCPKDEPSLTSKEFNLTTPSDIVIGSERLFLGVTGDLMGAPLRDLDKVIQLPTGCGEQNIAKFAPNIFAFRYMQATNNVDAAKEAEIRRNLRRGYQNQLKFRHNDGSFSVWGERARSPPSLMLTAFSMKMLLAAAPIIPETITPSAQNELREKTAKWIKNLQENTTGCFPLLGATFGDAVKGRDGASKGPMTSYALIQLLESNEQPNNTELALRCINAQKNAFPHNLAMAAYATVLAGNDTLANEYLEELEKIAVVKTNMRYWNSMHPRSSRTGDVEAAAYVVLAYLKLKKPEKAQPVVRFLASKQNPYGGFYSSQDTAIGLQAIAQFGQQLGAKPVNMKIQVTREPPETNNSETFTVQQDMRLVLQQRLYNRPAPAEVAAVVLNPESATGCALVINQLRYNVPFSPHTTGFAANVTTAPGPEGDQINVIITVRYTGEGAKSNMAVVEVEIPSGYTYVAEQLKMLEQDKAVQSVDYTNFPGMIILYYDKLTQDPTRTTVTLDKRYNVRKPEKSIVSIYDYYDIDSKLQVSYSIENDEA